MYALTDNIRYALGNRQLMKGVETVGKALAGLSTFANMYMNIQGKYQALYRGKFAQDLQDSAEKIARMYNDAAAKRAAESTLKKGGDVIQDIQRGAQTLGDSIQGLLCQLSNSCPKITPTPTPTPTPTATPVVAPTFGAQELSALQKMAYEMLDSANKYASSQISHYTANALALPVIGFGVFEGFRFLTEKLDGYYRTPGLVKLGGMTARSAGLALCGLIAYLSSDPNWYWIGAGLNVLGRVAESSADTLVTQTD